jgi:NUMOD3 motif
MQTIILIQCGSSSMHKEPWNKGKKNIYSAESKYKMRIAKLGKSSNRKDYTHSFETRQKISLSNKGKVSPNKGKKASAESKYKMSIAKLDKSRSDGKYWGVNKEKNI